MWTKTIYLGLLLSFMGISRASAQNTKDAVPKPDTLTQISILLNPYLQYSETGSEYFSPLLVGEYSQKIPFKPFLGFTSSILKSKYRDPSSFPYYGLGIERPQYFLEPITMTDYQLSLMRLNRYHKPSY